MADIAALIAPRPLVIEHGERDHIFPIGATRAAFTQLPPVWEELGARAPELGNGLCGLRERFESLGGELTVDGTAGFAVTGRVTA